MSLSVTRPAKTLTQSPTWPNHQRHRTAFESDNGRSVLEAGTALHAPNPSLPEATRRAWEGGKRFFAQKPAGMADRHSARGGEHNSGERTSARRAGGDDCIDAEAAAITVHREDQHQNQYKEISPRPVVIVVI